MFGTNNILKKDHGDGETLHLVKGSPFLTIQGEGPYTGHPAVFVRLHGCHLRCTFCDTDFDATDDPIWNRVNLVSRITDRKNENAKLVVITGGEPMRQNLLPLCWDLAEVYGFRIQIETAGTFWIEGIEKFADIVCSPKTPSIHPMIHKHAVAFKYVISGGQQFSHEKFGYVPITATQPGARPAQLALPRNDAPVYLSPCDEQDEFRNQFNRQLVGQLAIQHGVIAGIQLHKFLAVP